MEKDRGPTELAAPVASSATLDPRDIACLRAGKRLGLLRWETHGEVCPTSVHPTVGWWARASWDQSRPTYDKGGPWSVERVHALAESGLLGIEPSCKYASVTREGGKVLKALTDGGAAVKASPVDDATGGGTPTEGLNKNTTQVSGESLREGG